MVAHPQVNHLYRRQDPAPSDGFVTNGATTVGAATGGTSLVFDTAAPTSAGGTNSPPPVATTTVIDPDAPSTSLSSTTPTATPSISPANAASKPPLALGTVIASCVGAFIGAGALIALALFFYRRYSASLKRRHFRAPHARNMKGDQERRRSHMEAWNKLDDFEDAWDDRKQTKEMDHVAPMEKLTMFKKGTPSVRTAYTTAQDDTPLEYPPSFAPFDPKLAQTLGSNPPPMPEPRPFLGRIDANPVISWDNDSVANLSSRSASGAVSPSLNKAIPTPAATHFSHKWESAEVVGYAEPQAGIVQHGGSAGAPTSRAVDPFASEEDVNDRRSIHNPFFNAQDYTPQPRSRSNSVRSRSNSVNGGNGKARVESICPHPLTGPLTKSEKAKGKERMRFSQASQAQSLIDGQNEPNAPPPLPIQPQTPTIHHAPSNSASSVESKEHALKSLMAALEISEEEVKDRLRVASMQPSIISQTSQYTVDGDDVTREFPLPPNLQLSHQHGQPRP